MPKKKQTSPEFELESDCCQAPVHITRRAGGTTHWYECSKCGDVCCAGPLKKAKQEPEQYPEHEKLRAIEPLSQAQFNFIEWLRDKKKIRLAEPVSVAGSFRWWPVDVPIDKLLAEFHGIDMDKIEAEKRAMLQRIRETDLDEKE